MRHLLPGDIVKVKSSKLRIITPVNSIQIGNGNIFDYVYAYTNDVMVVSSLLAQSDEHFRGKFIHPLYGEVFIWFTQRVDTVFEFIE